MNKSQNGKYDQTANTFWNNVDYVLKERGMTWKGLAEKMEITPKTLSSKKSANCNVSVGSAKEMAEAIGTSVDRLLYGHAER